MSEEFDPQGYDDSPEGRELVALLQKYAPPATDSRAGAVAVMARLGKPAGRMIWMNWLPPLVGAAAAVALAFVILSPSPKTQPTQPGVARSDNQPSETPAVIRRDRAFPEIVALVRYNKDEGLWIDAGLKDGLRVGDTLEGAGGAQARITAAGVFQARVSVSGGSVTAGSELRTRVTTDAQVRAAKFSDFGGDPGAFLEFGVVVSAMSLSEARILGISDGAALRVDETIPGVIADPASAAKATLAARLDLRPGDVITEVNGMHVRTPSDFGSALGWSRDPNLLAVRILRNGKQLDLNLR